MQPSASANETNGTYTCPCKRLEVWRTSIRGARPSAIACSTKVNAPEMRACEAMMVAAVAKPTIGINDHPGVRA